MSIQSWFTSTGIITQIAWISCNMLIFFMTLQCSIPIRSIWTLVTWKFGYPMFLSSMTQQCSKWCHCKFTLITRIFSIILHLTLAWSLCKNIFHVYNRVLWLFYCSLSGWGTLSTFRVFYLKKFTMIQRLAYLIEIKEHGSLCHSIIQFVIAKIDILRLLRTYT